MCIAAFLSQTFSALFSAHRMDPVVCRTPLPRGVQSSAHCEAHASPWLPQWVPTSVQSNTYSQNFSQASTQRPGESCDIPFRVQSINAQLESELRSQISQTPNPMLFSPPHPGCHHWLVLSCASWEWCCGAQLSFPGHPLPAFRRRGTARLLSPAPSSPCVHPSEKDPSLKARSQKK